MHSSHVATLEAQCRSLHLECLLVDTTNYNTQMYIPNDFAQYTEYFASCRQKIPIPIPYFDIVS